MDRIEDINLPNSIVGRLIKDALPEGANLNKEARGTIARAASIFVIFLTSMSTTLARQKKHKSIHPKNIFDALTELDLESFIEPVQQDLAVYREMMKSRKDNKSNSKKGAATTTPLSVTNTNEDKNGNGNDEVIEDDEANVEGDVIIETVTNGYHKMEEDEPEEDEHEEDEPEEDEPEEDEPEEDEPEEDEPEEHKPNEK